MQGLESKNRRRINAYCLASIKVMGLVSWWRQEKRDRKIVGIKYKIFFVSDDRMQKLFDQKELQIKISVMQFTFNELCFVTIHEKPWAVAREVCRALEYGKATKNADIVKRLCSRNNYAHKWQLTELVSETNFMNWPRDSRKDDYYINGEGMYELVFSSQQPKTKNFRKHCCNVMLPRIRQQLVHKMK